MSFSDIGFWKLKKVETNLAKGVMELRDMVRSQKLLGKRRRKYDY